MAAQDVFVRKATGLVRDVGLGSGMFFNIAQSASLVNGPFFAFVWLIYGNSGNMWIAFIVGLIGGLLVNSVYAHFSAAMPRSGGEYIFLGRTMFAELGFVVNWCIVCVFFFWEVAQNLAVWNSLVNLLGFAYSPAYSGSYPAIQALLTSPLVVFLGTSMLALLVAAITIKGLGSYVKVQNIIWIFGMAAIVVMAVGFIIATANFSSTFNAWALQYVPTEPDMYHKIINDAAAAGFSMHPEGPWLEQTMATTAYNATSVALYAAVTAYVGGEIKRAESGKRQHIMIEGAGIFLIATLAMTTLTFVNMTGLNFISSFFFLGSVKGLPLTTWLWSWYEIGLGPYWGFFVVLMTALTMFLTSCTILFVVSRCMLAWSFDRVVPSMLAHVSDRYKSPTYAIAAGTIITIILLGIANFENIFLAAFLASAPLWININIIIVSVAGAIFPYIRKDLYEKMPLKAEIGGVPLLTIIGLSGAGVLLWTCSVYFTNAAYWSSLGVSSIALPVSIFIYGSAVIIFYTARALNKRKGIDMSLAFKQIPPA